MAELVWYAEGFSHSMVRQRSIVSTRVDLVVMCLQVYIHFCLHVYGHFSDVPRRVCIRILVMCLDVYVYAF